MSKQADYTHGEPPPIPNNSPSLHDLAIKDLEVIQFDTSGVRALLESRKKFGYEKYGTHLQANNGRDPYVDCLEELGDALVYLRQCVEEAPPEWRSYLRIQFVELASVVACLDAVDLGPSTEK